MTRLAPLALSSTLALLLPLAFAPAPQESKTTAAAAGLKLGRTALRDINVDVGRTRTCSVAMENVSGALLHVRRATVKGEGISLSLVKLSARLPVTLDQDFDFEVPVDEKVRLDVILDAKGLPLGERKATVTLTADGGDVALPIEWEVVAPNDDKDDDRPTMKPKTDPSKFLNNGPPPVLRCDTYQHDFGDVFAGEHLNTAFKLRNEGEGDLVIVKIATQCHCTLPKLTLPGGVVPKKSLLLSECYGTLKPGEEATLDAEVDTAGMSGFYKKKIDIYTSDVARSPQIVWMTFNVGNPFQFQPSSANFGELRRGARLERTIRMASLTLGKFGITGFALPDPHPFDVDFHEVPARKGEQCAWELKLKTRDDLPCGDYSGKLLLELDHEKIHTLDQFHYSMRVLPDVQWAFGNLRSTPAINLGVVRPGMSDVQTITLENTNPSVPWIPKEAKVVSSLGADPYQTEIVELEKGMRYEVKLKVVSRPKLLSFRGDLVITADHPTQPEIKISFQGIYTTNARK